MPPQKPARQVYYDWESLYPALLSIAFQHGMATINLQSDRRRQRSVSLRGNQYDRFRARIDDALRELLDETPDAYKMPLATLDARKSA